MYRGDEEYTSQNIALFHELLSCSMCWMQIRTQRIYSRDNSIVQALLMMPYIEFYPAAINNIHGSSEPDVFHLITVQPPTR